MCRKKESSLYKQNYYTTRSKHKKIYCEDQKNTFIFFLPSQKNPRVQFSEARGTRRDSIKKVRKIEAIKKKKKKRSIFSLNFLVNFPRTTERIKIGKVRQKKIRKTHVFVNIKIAKREKFFFHLVWCKQKRSTVRIFSDATTKPRKELMKS